MTDISFESAKTNLLKPDPLALIESARSGGYAVGGFNMHNPETTQALIRAAEIAHAIRREQPLCLFGLLF